MSTLRFKSADQICEDNLFTPANSKQYQQSRHEVATLDSFDLSYNGRDYKFKHTTKGYFCKCLPNSFWVRITEDRYNALKKLKVVQAQ